jgi:hypothetical protein
MHPVSHDALIDNSRVKFTPGYVDAREQLQRPS